MNKNNLSKTDKAWIDGFFEGQDAERETQMRQIYRCSGCLIQTEQVGFCETCQSKREAGLRFCTWVQCPKRGARFPVDQMILTGTFLFCSDLCSAGFGERVSVADE